MLLENQKNNKTLRHLHKTANIGHTFAVQKHPSAVSPIGSSDMSGRLTMSGTSTGSDKSVSCSTRQHDDRVLLHQQIVTSRSRFRQCSVVAPSSNGLRRHHRHRLHRLYRLSRVVFIGTLSVWNQRSLIQFSPPFRSTEAPMSSSTASHQPNERL